MSYDFDNDLYLSVLVSSYNQGILNKEQFKNKIVLYAKSIGLDESFIMDFYNRIVKKEFTFEEKKQFLSLIKFDGTDELKYGNLVDVISDENIENLFETEKKKFDDNEIINILSSNKNVNEGESVLEKSELEKVDSMDNQINEEINDGTFKEVSGELQENVEEHNKDVFPDLNSEFVDDLSKIYEGEQEVDSDSHVDVLVDSDDKNLTKLKEVGLNGEEGLHIPKNVGDSFIPSADFPLHDIDIPQLDETHTSSVNYDEKKDSVDEKKLDYEIKDGFTFGKKTPSKKGSAIDFGSIIDSVSGDNSGVYSEEEYVNTHDNLTREEDDSSVKFVPTTKERIEKLKKQKKSVKTWFLQIGLVVLGFYIFNPISMGVTIAGYNLLASKIKDGSFEPKNKFEERAKDVIESIMYIGTDMHKLKAQERKERKNGGKSL